MGPLATAIIPGLVTGGLSLAGQAGANAANARMAREQMAFQERMRSTQYQTQVEDLKKAGLNPALAYGAGGAGTPVGARADMQSVTGGAAQSATAVMSNLAQLEKTAAETKLLHKQTSGQDVQNQILTYKWLSDVVGYQVTKETAPALIRKIIAESKAAETGATQAETSLLLSKLGIPEAKAYADFYNSALGRMDPYINSASGAAGAVMKMLPIGRVFRGPITSAAQRFNRWNVLRKDAKRGAPLID